MTRWGYLWSLVRHSFHGTLRTLEVGEAVVALTVYGAGWFVPEWEKPLKVLFVALLGLLILTFFVGIFLAAYASNQEAEAEKRRLEEKAAREREELARGYEVRLAELVAERDRLAAGAHAQGRQVAVGKRLAELHDKGADLQARIQANRGRDGLNGHNEEYKAWLEQVCAYLAENVSAAKAATVRNAISGTVFYSAVSQPGNNLLRRLDARLDRLAEIMRDY